jgi:hypothetical protein
MALDWLSISASASGPSKTLYTKCLLTEKIMLNEAHAHPLKQARTHRGHRHPPAAMLLQSLKKINSLVLCTMSSWSRREKSHTPA